MSSEGEAKTNRRGEPRVPFEGAVRLRYRLFQEFLEENAANISSGGMFIRTIHPGKLGSELEFELRLDDDFTLVQGRGEVVWVRDADQQPGAEPGMGIRFVELEGDSRELVEKIVRERVKAGLELFDLDSHAPAPEAVATARPAAATPVDDGDRPIWELDPGSAAHEKAASSSDLVVEETVDEAVAEGNLASLDPELPKPAAGRESVAAVTAATRRPDSTVAVKSRSSPLRLVAVAVLSALVGAGAVLTFYWFFVQPSIDKLETRIDELAGNPGGPWQPPAAEPSEPSPNSGEAGAEEPPTGEPAAAAAAGQSAEVVNALRGWAAAWTAQRPDDYLAYYSASFEPPDGLGRAAWEEARRARIERPQWIRVALTLVQVEPTSAISAEVGFVQSYRSERYKDLVRKRMSMVHEDGGWKILAERSAP